MKVQGNFVQPCPTCCAFHTAPQMMYSKASEIFAESIPAGILQMYVYVQSSNRSMAAAGSIFISALATGFASALCSYGKVV